MPIGLGSPWLPQSRGGGAPWQGAWGMYPQNFERGGELPPLAHPPRMGSKTLANPQPTGVGKGGPGGAKPPGKGLWGVSPHKTKRGSELPPLAHPPRGGPKTPANHQPTGVGKIERSGARPYAKPYGEITTKVPGLSGEEYTKLAPTGRAGSVQ